MEGATTRPPRLPAGSLCSLSSCLQVGRQPPVAVALSPPISSCMVASPGQGVWLLGGSWWPSSAGWVATVGNQSHLTWPPLPTSFQGDLVSSSGGGGGHEGAGGPAAWTSRVMAGQRNRLAASPCILVGGRGQETQGCLSFVLSILPARHPPVPRLPKLRLKTGDHHTFLYFPLAWDHHGPGVWSQQDSGETAEEISSTSLG